MLRVLLFQLQLILPSSVSAFLRQTCQVCQCLNVVYSVLKYGVLYILTLGVISIKIDSKLTPDRIQPGGSVRSGTDPQNGPRSESNCTSQRIQNRWKYLEMFIRRSIRPGSSLDPSLVTSSGTDLVFCELFCFTSLLQLQFITVCVFSCQHDSSEWTMKTQ